MSDLDIELEQFDEAVTNLIERSQSHDGQVIETGFMYRPANEVPGAIVSGAEQIKLQEKLREVDHAQAVGRITSRQYFIS